MDFYSVINSNIFIITSFVVIFLVWFVMLYTYYKRRAFIIGICRLVWIIPVILCLFPVDKIIRIKTDFIKENISVLVDDSYSMVQSGYDYKDKIKEIESLCQLRGCSLNVDYLSRIYPYNSMGYTPLKEVLGTWLSSRVGPWILITDGGDSLSKIGWNINYKYTNTSNKGYILGYIKETPNKWIASIESSSLAFEDSPISMFLRIKRNTTKKEVIQIQVMLDDKIVFSQNVDFIQSKTELDVDMSIPPLKRGTYNFKVKIVPSENEQILWDNEAYVNVEVSTNTLGVLHIQGSPNWDGRFIRRYLKSDPKFDLISFFILRDMFDNLDATERESSLIPFPVERLFVNEINHFKVIVLQNFSLYKFLQSAEYQANIVNFVKQGGGLLFIGGANALRDMDIFHKDFSSIIPFEVKYKMNRAENPGFGMFEDMDDDGSGEGVKRGPYYSKNSKFNIELVNLSSTLRSFYDVYDDWSRYDSILKNTEFSGLHRMNNTTLKQDSTVLANAISSTTKEKIPVIVGSHPGKGRALWIFTDSLWKLAFSKESRNVYNDIMSSSMRWLMYQDSRPYLKINSFMLDRSVGSKKIHWSSQLEGGAVRYIDTQAGWQIEVCGKKVDDIMVDSVSSDISIISGSLDDDITQNTCTINIKGTNSVLGYVSVKGSSYLGTLIPDIKKDIKNGSQYILEQLASITHSDMSINGNPYLSSKTVDSWLEQGTSKMDFETKHEKDPFWFFRSWWFYGCLLFIPLEVLIRKKII